MPLQATSGAASYDAFGGGVAVVPTYIEDVFSTYLYDGNSSTQTITNGIDLSTKGGLVWAKSRNTANFHLLVDTVRGFNSEIYSNSTSAASTSGSDYTSWNTNGYSLGFISGNENVSGRSFVSWTFREQPKFFDVVTYSGNNAAQNIAHSLGSAPGCIIVKDTSAATNWVVFHRSLGNAQWIKLNGTDAADPASAIFWNLTDPTSTVFSVGTALSVTGRTYVAYLFAHDAGGFGLTGTDNVISCGSFTTDGSGNATVSLGYEPQWVMVKRYDTAQDWYMMDVMRGMNVSGTGKALSPNTADAEITFGNPTPTATGFQWVGGQASAPLIYIAIRRGPMKVPTLGTSVFSPNASSGSTGTALVTNFPVDLSISTVRSGDNRYFSDRLRGINSPGLTANRPYLSSDTTNAEATGASFPRGWDNTQITVPPYYSGSSSMWWNFQRAPGFFDEVCDSGTGGTKTITHNLGVAPELWIRKRRDSATYGNWYTYTSALGNTKYLILETTAAQATATADVWNLTTPTATTLYVGGDLNLFGGGAGTYVNYLFATCAGVSKVGSYTGTGALQTVNCGFASGARFVLIKRTDSTGDWYVYDSARGISSGNDPYLFLNSTAAEVTSTNYVDTDTTGFKVTAAAPAGLNANGGTYIFLAIA